MQAVVYSTYKQQVGREELQFEMQKPSVVPDRPAKIFVLSAMAGHWVLENPGLVLAKIHCKAGKFAQKQRTSGGTFSYSRESRCWEKQLLGAEVVHWEWHKVPLLLAELWGHYQLQGLASAIPNGNMPTAATCELFFPALNIVESIKQSY